MAEIDGVHEGSHVGRALARSKFKRARAAEEARRPASPGGPSGEPEAEAIGKDGAAVEKLKEIHPHAAEAVKSFHAYLHPDGKVHVHTHDHQTMEQEHREHPDATSAAQHFREHMGGEEPGGEGEPSGEPMTGLESLGMGEAPESA